MAAESLVGQPLALTIVSIVLLVTSWAVVVARSLIRIRLNTFRIDDQLMAIGFLFTATTGCAIAGAYTGIGSERSHNSGRHKDESPKPYLFIILVQIFYTVSLCPIRSSIAAHLLRFTTTNPTNRRILCGIIATTILTSFITFIGILTQTKPLHSLWGVDKSSGKHPSFRIRWYSFFVTSVSIVLDVLIAFMPYKILWSTTLNRRTKLSVAALLSLGGVGCIATTIALAFTITYRKEEGLTGRAALATCHIVELGCGIIAGSAAALKPLFTGRWRTSSG